SLQTGTYSGTVNVTTVSGQTTFGVTLTVGGTTSGTGLSATPNPVTFTVPTAGQNPTQVVTVTLNGAPAAVTTTTFVASPVLAPTFVDTAVNADGTVTLTVNNVVATPGFYQGTLTLFTATGNVSVPVQLTFGSGAGGSTGLSANPN